MSTKNFVVFGKRFKLVGAIPRPQFQPEIEVLLIDNPEIAPQGCGEPAYTKVRAVLANAIFDAIGVRLFEPPWHRSVLKKLFQKEHRNGFNSFLNLCLQL